MKHQQYQQRKDDLQRQEDELRQQEDALRRQKDELRRQNDQIKREEDEFRVSGFLLEILQEKKSVGEREARASIYAGIVSSMTLSRYRETPRRLTCLTHGAFVALSRCFTNPGEWYWIMEHEGVLENHSKDFNNQFPLNVEHSGQYLSVLLKNENVEGAKLFLEDLSDACSSLARSLPVPGQHSKDDSGSQDPAESLPGPPGHQQPESSTTQSRPAGARLGSKAKKPQKPRPRKRRRSSSAQNVEAEAEHPPLPPTPGIRSIPTNSEGTGNAPHTASTSSIPAPHCSSCTCNLLQPCSSTSSPQYVAPSGGPSTSTTLYTSPRLAPATGTIPLTDPLHGPSVSDSCAACGPSSALPCPHTSSLVAVSRKAHEETQALPTDIEPQAPSQSSRQTTSLPPSERPADLIDKYRENSPATAYYVLAEAVNRLLQSEGGLMLSLLIPTTDKGVPPFVTLVAPIFNEKFKALVHEPTTVLM